MQAENEGDEASPEASEDPGPEGSADTEDALGRGHAVIAELCGNSEWLQSWASIVWAEARWDDLGNIDAGCPWPGQ